jgi:hypothetical protein
LRQANPQLQIADSVLNPKQTAKTIFNDGDTVVEGHEFDFDDLVINSRAYRRIMAMAREAIKGHASTTTTAPQTEQLRSSPEPLHTVAEARNQEAGTANAAEEPSPETASDARQVSHPVVENSPQTRPTANAQKTMADDDTRFPDPSTLGLLQPNAGQISTVYRAEEKETEREREALEREVEQLRSENLALVALTERMNEMILETHDLLKEHLKVDSLAKHLEELI